MCKSTIKYFPYQSVRRYCFPFRVHKEQMAASGHDEFAPQCPFPIRKKNPPKNPSTQHHSRYHIIFQIDKDEWLAPQTLHKLYTTGTHAILARELYLIRTL